VEAKDGKWRDDNCRHGPCGQPRPAQARCTEGGQLTLHVHCSCRGHGETGAAVSSGACIAHREVAVAGGSVGVCVGRRAGRWPFRGCSRRSGRGWGCEGRSTRASREWNAASSGRPLMSPEALPGSDLWGWRQAGTCRSSPPAPCRSAAHSFRRVGRRCASSGGRQGCRP
jgi:hypothetical protein